MGIFGKKEEKKEDIVVNEPDEVKQTEGLQTPVDPNPSTPPPAPESPESMRHKTAAVMIITYYPDNHEIKVEGAQNLTNRALATIMIERVYNTYKADEIAHASAIKLVDLLAKMQDSKRILVPGRK